MRSHNGFVRFAMFSLVLVSAMAIIGCAGKGDSDSSNVIPNTAPAGSWNVTLVNGPGLSWNQMANQVVPDGNKPVYTATLDVQHYSNFGATGLQGTVNVSGGQLTFTCAAVHAVATLTGTSSPYMSSQQWTVNFVSVSGANWSTSSLFANDGQQVQNDLRLQSPGTLVGINVSDGSSSTYQVDQNDATLIHVTTAPVHSNVSLTPNVSTSSPTGQFTTTFVDGPHSHFLASSAIVQQGGSVSVNIRVDTGYGQPVVSSSDGNVTVLVVYTTDATLYSVTCGPIEKNCTFIANE